MTDTTSENLGAKHAGTVGAINAVLKFRSQLETAFTPNRENRQTVNEQAIASLRHYLSLVGWRGRKRQFFETLPHMESIDTIYSLQAVFYRLGYKTVIEQARPEVFRNEFLPCLLRENSGRLYTVVSKNDDGSLEIVEPTTKSTTRKFPDELIGEVIFPEQRSDFTETKTPQSTSWIITALRSLKPVILQIFFLSFVINIFALLPPLYVMAVYDKAISAKSVDILIGLTTGILLIAITEFALRHIRTRLQSYLGARLDEQSSESAFRQLLYFPLSMTEDAPIGSQLTRLRQMTSLRDIFTGVLATAIFDMPFITMFIAAIAIIAGPLVFIPLGLIALYGLIALWATPLFRRLLRKLGDTKAKIQAMTVETVTHHRAIRELSAEGIWAERYRKLSAEAAFANMKVRQFNLLVQSMSQSLLSMAGVLVLAIGVGKVVSGDLSSGALIALMALSWRVLGPIRGMFLSSMTFGQTVQSINQINALMRMPLETTPEKAPTIERRFNGEITLNQVGFRYASRRDLAVRGVSLAVRPGEIIAICGASGAGKTTILKLILGLYQQQGGAVLTDGMDTRQIDCAEWRQAVGHLPESIDFFYGTIAQNLRLADPAATQEDLDKIAKAFGVTEYCQDLLHDGLETKITPQALQTWPDPLKKRLALCRAFVKDCPLYLLDNPTDNLDMEGEKAFLSHLEKLRGKRTIIMVTHRPSHMKMADKILWMNEGAVVAFDQPEKVLPSFLAA